MNHSLEHEEGTAFQDPEAPAAVAVTLFPQEWAPVNKALQQPPGLHHPTTLAAAFFHPASRPLSDLSPTMGICSSSCCGGTRIALNPAAAAVIHDADADAIAIPGRSRDGLYEPVLADSEREAVADLLQYLENVCLCPITPRLS